MEVAYTCKTRNIGEPMASGPQLRLSGILALWILVTGCGGGGGGFQPPPSPNPSPSRTPRFAYVANVGSNNVSMYTIDASTGALTSIGTIPAGMNPNGVRS